jgi:hypothetical protein
MAEAYQDFSYIDDDDQGDDNDHEQDYENRGYTFDQDGDDQDYENRGYTFDQDGDDQDYEHRGYTFDQDGSDQGDVDQPDEVEEDIGYRAQDIMITSSGFPALIQPAPGLDLIVLDEYEDDLMYPILKGSQELKAHFFEHFSFLCPNVKIFKIRDNYLVIAYRQVKNYPNPVEENKEMQNFVVTIINDLFERREIPKKRLPDGVIHLDFYKIYLQELETSTNRFLFSHSLPDGVDIYGIRGSIDDLFRNRRYFHEYKMEKSVNYLQSFRALNEYLKELEQRAGLKVSVDREDNTIQLEGTFQDCTFYVAFVKYFLSLLTQKSLYLTEEQLERIDLFKPEIDRKLAEIEVFLDQSTSSLCALKTKPNGVFYLAKDYITQICGINFTKSVINVEECLEEFKLTYLKEWKKQIQDRYTDVAYNVLPRFVRINGFKDGVDCLLGFIDSIVAKKFDFTDVGFAERCVQAQQNTAENICFETYENHVLIIGMEDSVEKTYESMIEYTE